ncbi:MAG: hypothetical protein JNJ57_15710 [Saprospiraceae bacterium]|nr:hypothetical protein [Saprospiraceae bacterium]
MADNGKLEKAYIISYPNRDFSGDTLRFDIPINPESYTKNYKIEYDVRRPSGGRGADARFKSTAPEQLKLDFILDGTNTMEGYKFNEPLTDEVASIKNRKVADEDAVLNQLNNFLSTVYRHDRDIHRPRFVKIYWGEDRQLFKGILTNLDLNYALFHPSGKPLRVKISATFLDYVAQDQREKENNQRSPDISRLKMLKAGERLDQHVSDIYNNNKFLVQVAAANNLTTFRRIQEGTQLRFPPLDKTEVA